MVGCLVISHGNIAQALVETAQKIAGQCDGLFSFSSDASLPQVRTEIEQLIGQEQFSDGFIIMACLKGGSGWNVSRAVSDGRENTALLSGTNLPMILSFITKRNQHSFQQLVELLAADARRGIVEIKP